MVIAAVAVEHAEPLHVPEPEFGMVRNDLNPAAFPPAAVSPLGPHRMLQGKAPLRRTGWSQGQYVLHNADGTTRLVSVGMR